MATSATFKREAYAAPSGSTIAYALPDGGRFEAKIGAGGELKVEGDVALAYFRADPDWLEQGEPKTPKGANPDGTPTDPPAVVGAPAPGTSDDAPEA
jgi:hypothetical protein